MVRRLLCLLLVELQSRRNIFYAEIAVALHRLNAAEYVHTEVENTVREMLDAGSRYINLENALGPGTVFVLGKDLSESLY
jgi:hypothetical protein